MQSVQFPRELAIKSVVTWLALAVVLTGEDDFYYVRFHKFTRCATWLHMDVWSLYTTEPQMWKKKEHVINLVHIKTWCAALVGTY